MIIIESTLDFKVSSTAIHINSTHFFSFSYHDGKLIWQWFRKTTKADEWTTTQNKKAEKIQIKLTNLSNKSTLYIHRHPQPHQVSAHLLIYTHSMSFVKYFNDAENENENDNDVCVDVNVDVDAPKKPFNHE